MQNEDFLKWDYSLIPHDELSMDLNMIFNYFE